MLVPNVEDNYHTVGLKLLSSFYWINQVTAPNLRLIDMGQHISLITIKNARKVLEIWSWNFLVGSNWNHEESYLVTAKSTSSKDAFYLRVSKMGIFSFKRQFLSPKTTLFFLKRIIATGYQMNWGNIFGCCTFAAAQP